MIPLSWFAESCFTNSSTTRSSWLSSWANSWWTWYTSKSWSKNEENSFSWTNNLNSASKYNY